MLPKRRLVTFSYLLFLYGCTRLLGAKPVFWQDVTLVMESMKAETMNMGFYSSE